MRSKLNEMKFAGWEKKVLVSFFTEKRKKLYETSIIKMQKSVKQKVLIK